MALTAAQSATLYRIYKIPPDGVISVYADTVSTGTASFMHSINVSSIVTTIDSRAAALTSDEETDLIALLTEYDTITLGSTSKMQGGSIGSMTGISESDPNRRDQIRDEVEDLIGVHLDRLYALIDELKGGGGRIKAIR